MIGGDAPVVPITSAKRPMPGESFGPYRILRLLGTGGMGEVYEAEHSETSRRVALKVMNHALQTEADRKRFLREGRLAASVNHPNVVYIHGSEEIDSVPVIAMELVHGGTLKDRLKKEGMLPVADAVENALEIIDGLEQAHAAGVLHRDIKPANCFVAADGRIKVGDFGLSVSTIARGESLLTATGTVVGTPAYASPEQLRGQDLDITSDIYSVGATLYHLLTGKTPFAATDFIKLITEVLDKEPASPHQLGSNVPAELSRVVLRCLAKDKKARFQSYKELRDALLPFRQADVEPARPTKRFLAGLADDLIAYFPAMLFLFYRDFDPLDLFVRERTLAAAMVWIGFYSWYFLYYTVAEGLWGAGVGKTILGLRVVDSTRQAPGPAKASLRVAVYASPMVLPSLIYMVFVSQDSMRAVLSRGESLPTDWLWVLLTILLFVTMRRRNGYAALHDLISGTRVIVRPKTESRPALSEDALLPLVGTPEGIPFDQCGPYAVQQSLYKTATEQLLLAFDPTLQRKIWVHFRELSAPPIPSERRDLSRPARLRWLNSGKTETHLWDAYEAVEGIPFLTLAEKGSAWQSVRYWLLDLAQELNDSDSNNETKPHLSLDRIWISRDNAALLLDFPAPALALHSNELFSSDIAGAQMFLDRIVKTALKSSGSDQVVRASVPLHAQTFLQSLAKGAFEKLEFIIGNLHSLISKPAEISRSWRFASLGVTPVILAALSIASAISVNYSRIRWERAWADAYPEKPSLRSVTQMYSDLIDEQQQGEAKAEDVGLATIYINEHLADVITNETFWANPAFGAEFDEHTRSLLKQAVIGHNAPTSEQIEEANRAVPRWFKKTELIDKLTPLSVFIAIFFMGSALLAVIEFGSALIFRAHPTLALFGLDVMDRKGNRASRGRLLWRWSLLWFPLGFLGIIAGLGLASGAYGLPLLDTDPAEKPIVRTIAWILFAFSGSMLVAIVTYAILHPIRTLHDRLARTVLVPK